MDIFLQYAPVIIVVLIFLIQQRIVVTPEQLERKHREILEDVDKKYVTWTSFNNVLSQLNEVKSTVNKIYDKLLEGNTDVR